MKKTALLLIAVLAMTVGCQPAPTPTPLPTTTPLPTITPTPIPTPAFALECSGSWNPMGGIGGGGSPVVDIKIVGESGKFTQSMSSKMTWVDKQGWTTTFEGTRTYEGNGNKYTIVAEAFPYAKGSQGPILVAYEVKVTGGGFSATTQTCQSKATFQ